MFDLHARVHLNEVKLAVLVQKLEGAGAAVADFAAGVGAALADLVAQFLRQSRRRALLDHLLVPALERAVALAQMNRVAVLVGQHLDFDVPRVMQIFSR